MLLCETRPVPRFALEGRAWFQTTELLPQVLRHWHRRKLRPVRAVSQGLLLGIMNITAWFLQNRDMSRVPSLIQIESGTRRPPHCRTLERYLSPPCAS